MPTILKREQVIHKLIRRIQEITWKIKGIEYGTLKCSEQTIGPRTWSKNAINLSRRAKGTACRQWTRALKGNSLSLERDWTILRLRKRA